MVVWERFLLHLMPRTTQQERALYFEIASSFADNLDVLGFMDLRQASWFAVPPEAMLDPLISHNDKIILSLEQFDAITISYDTVS